MSFGSGAKDDGRSGGAVVLRGETAGVSRASVRPCKAAVAMLLMRGEGETTDGSIPAFTSGGMEIARCRGGPG